jgi:hypothetical protein
MLHGRSALDDIRGPNADGWPLEEGAMRVARLGAMDLPTALLLLLGGGFCYSAWLTSIVFCAAAGYRPLLIASAMFFPIGVVHGVGVWFGGW